MAILKQRLHKKNSSGSYDTIYLETSANMITAGTLAADVIATVSTDYNSYRLRNIAILTEVPTNMNEGDIALVVT